MAEEEKALDTTMDPNFDYMYKILMVGNSGVGKTAFVARYCDDKFNDAFISTVGIDFRVKNVIRNDKRIKLQIWDTAGQERYQSITQAYYHGANGFIVMFDLTSDETFQACRNWISQIRELSLEDVVLVLVGNKVDLGSQRVITYEQAKELATSMGVEYFETSAKENTNITQTYEHLVDLISDTMAATIEKNPDLVPRGVKPKQVNSGEKKDGSGCGC